MGNEKESKVLSKLQFFLWVGFQSIALLWGGAYFTGRQASAIEALSEKANQHDTAIRRIDMEGSTRLKTTDVYQSRELERLNKRVEALDAWMQRNNDILIRIEAELKRKP